MTLPQRCLLAIGFALWGFALPAFPQADEELPKAFKKIYYEYIKLGLAHEHFDKLAPESAATNAAAFLAWQRHYNLTDFVRVGRQQFPDAMADTEKKFPRPGKMLNFAVNMMVRNYTSFSAFTADTRLDLCCRKQLALIAPLLPKPEPAAITTAPPPPTVAPPKTTPPSTAPPTAVPPTTVPPTTVPPTVTVPGAQRLYSVLDLNAVVGQAMLQAVRSGQRAKRRDAATAALQGLGKAIFISGTVGKRGSTLEYETPESLSRWSVYLNFTSDADQERVARLVGQQVTVLCQPTRLGVFIETSACRYAAQPVGLTPANLPLPANALRRKDVPPEQLIAQAGQGLPTTKVDGVYLRQATSIGVGGMVLITFDPFLLLKDNTVYSQPFHAAEAFAFARSQQREPHNWGQLTWLTKDKAKVVWQASNDEEDDREDEWSGIFKLIPAPPGQKLQGRFSHTSGGGNTAIGGTTSIISERAFTFTADGRFQRDGFTGGSTGGDLGPTVVFSNTKASKQGRYHADGFSITLTYDSGQVERLLFAAQDLKFDFLCIGGTMYVSRK